MVAVDHTVVGDAQHTIFLDIGHTVVAVFFIKTVLQLVVGIVDGLHDRIVDHCIFHCQPCHHIIVFTEGKCIGIVSQCKALALYDTGVSAEYGDKLLTLSTCEYSRANGRMVVLAKLIVPEAGGNA